jgi:hypothetical protein
MLPSLHRARRDLPQDLCAAIDAALLPRPEERGTLGDLADALADALPAVSDEGGTVAPHPLEARPRVGGHASERAGAGLLAGGLAAGGLAALGEPAAAGVAVGAAAAVFPRAGWLTAALCAVGLLGARAPGAAVLVAVALAPVPLLLRRAGTTWTVPALAPALGVVSLAGAYPALAGGARGWLRRAALGALGAWWALLAEPLLGRALLTGDGTGGPLAHGSAAAAVRQALGPLVTGGALLYALVWAAAAMAMPWLVRGRWLLVDVVGAGVWAAALGAATAAVAQSLGAPAPRGLVAGAVAAGVIAPALMRVADRRAVEP